MTQTKAPHRRLPAPTRRGWLVYGRFGKARGGQVIQEWRGQAGTLTAACRAAILDIMRRPEIKRLRHETATFTIERLLPLNERSTG